MNPLIECLGWTLVHFIWQGVAIALLLAIALRLLRRGTADQRYLAGCAALALMVVAPLVTSHLVEKAEPVPAQAVSIAPVEVSPNPGIAALQAAIQPKKSSFTLRPGVFRPDFVQRLKMILPWLVMGWSMGVLALSCRLLAGWLQIKRWQRAASETLAETWRQKLDELARRLSISKPVRLVQSLLVEVPTVVGWLRPVILLPASCLSGLTPEQLESILAHELAHIRRHDYLVNLLQSVVETLLFYHPAVWWVSRRIGEERENCCDDIAVRICGDPVTYARALATLEEMRSAPAQLALAADGAPLLERVQRLLGKSGGNATPTAWPLAGTIVVIALMAVVMGLRENRAMASEPPVPETFITHFGVYHFTNNGAATELTVETNRVFVSATRGSTPSLEGTSSSSAGVRENWSPRPHWFVYIGKDWHVWAYDGAQGLWLVAADSKSSKMRSLSFLDEIPPDAVFKQLPKQLKKTVLEIETPNSRVRKQLEELIRDGEAQSKRQPHSQMNDEKQMATGNLDTSTGTDRSQFSKKREAILSKLDQIRLDSVKYDGIPLFKALTQLYFQVKMEDPRKSGMAFDTDNSLIIDGEVIDRLTGVKHKAPKWFGDVRVKINPALTNARLVDVLDAIAAGAEKPIHYSVTENGVEFSSGKAQIPLETRTYYVESGKFLKALERAGFSPHHTETNAQSQQFTGPYVNGGSSTWELHVKIREYFKSLGVDFGTNTSSVDKAVLFNDRKGVLFVRATAKEMEVVTAALERVNSEDTLAATPAASSNPPSNAGTTATFTVATNGTQPLAYQWNFNGTNIAGAAPKKPQINIKVKFEEVTEPIGNSNGFDWVLKDSWAAFTTNPIPPPKFVSPYILKDSNSTTHVELTVTNSIISESMAILNERPHSMVMQNLKAQSDANILTAPEVTTRDNGRAQVQMLDTMTVVVGTNTALGADGKTGPHYLTESIGLGTIFDLIPKVSDDGLSVKLKMTASVTKLKGYAKANIPIPLFYGQALETEATVPDGQTLILAGRGAQMTIVMKDKVPVLGSIPLLGRLFQSTSTSIVRKDLLVFITPTLIHPDGTRYHSKAESNAKSISGPPPAIGDETKKTN